MRDALNEAIEKLKQAEDIEEPTREGLHLDSDIQGTTGSPDLVRTIFEKIEKSDVFVGDVTAVGITDKGDKLINSNVAIELGYALHARSDAKVLLVFNSHYGRHEDLPFNLRHKGGSLVFTLNPTAERSQIDTQRKELKDKFAVALKPLLQIKPATKTSRSLKAHIRSRALSVPGGGNDELYMLLASVENDGQEDVTDFRLDVDIPVQFLDGGGYRLQVQSDKPGFAKFRIANNDPAVKIEHFYSGDKTNDIITFNFAIRGQVRRTSPKYLDQEITATVYSSSMQPQKTVKTIAQLTAPTS